MPFVKRDSAGRVIALYQERIDGAEEYLPPDHPLIRAFIAATGARPEDRSELLKSDLEMIRVYEDLIDILVGKRVVVLTDFPPAAQEKLVRRKRLRTSFGALAEVLTPDDEGGIP